MNNDFLTYGGKETNKQWDETKKAKWIEEQWKQVKDRQKEGKLVTKEIWMLYNRIRENCKDPLITEIRTCMMEGSIGAAYTKCIVLKSKVRMPEMQELINALEKMIEKDNQEKNRKEQKEK